MQLPELVTGSLVKLSHSDDEYTYETIAEPNTETPVGDYTVAARSHTPVSVHVTRLLFFRQG